MSTLTKKLLGTLFGILIWIVYFAVIKGDILIASLFCIYILTWLGIRYIDNPNALVYSYLPKDERLNSKALIIIMSLCFIMFILGTVGAVVLLDHDQITMGLRVAIIALLYILFVITCLKERVWYKENLDYGVTDFKEASDFLKMKLDDEQSDTLVCVKNFSTVEEAEEYQKQLEQKGIPSVLYGANKPDYISREVLPVQVLVQKQYKSKIKS